MSRHTWGIIIYGLALKPDTIKEKYRKDVMECNLLKLKSDLREDRIELPPFLGFDLDKERVMIGYFPVYPWVINRYNKSVIPQTEQEAEEMIKKVLAKIVVDISAYSDYDFESISTYDCGCRQTWGVTLFGLELKPDTIKEKYREDVMDCDLLEFKSHLREDRIELPPFLGFNYDNYDKERFYIGYFPVYPWSINNRINISAYFPVYPWAIYSYNKSAIPQTEQEAMEMIKKVLAKIAIDISAYSDDDFDCIDSFNCG